MTTVDFSCTLPVVIQGEPQYGWSGGFVTFPDATYQADPAGVLEAVGDGEIGSQAQPKLYGYILGSPFYDLAQRRWIPAPAGHASADGSTYAFASPPLGGSEQPISTVSVATGAVQTVKIAFPPSAGVAWQVADYDGRYVYLVAAQIDQFPAGVWRLDPTTGDLRQLLPTSAGHVLQVREGIAWLGQVDPADPSPPRPPKGEAFDTIASVDLATGKQTTWFYAVGGSVTLLGVDESNRPVVSTAPGPDFDTSHGTYAFVSTPPGGGLPTGIETGLYLFGMQADVGRIWFGGETGIYYWTVATGLRKAFAYPVDLAAGKTIAPAGRCV